MGKKYVSQIDKHLLMPLGLHKPSECVMIGDHLELDINGAKKCGINTIWVNSKNIEMNIKYIDSQMFHFLSLDRTHP